MKTITFSAYICGMSENTFSDKIMIYEPLAKYEKIFVYEEITEITVNEFLNTIKKDADEFLCEYGVEKLAAERVYICVPDALIGMQEDKTLAELFEYFSTDNIKFAYFLVGGASIHCSGYRFTVHPNEEIHRNTPHVHVCKDGKSVRYTLDTLERFEQDKLPRDYKRDEKKVIVPYLLKNQTKLIGYWNYYMNGYTVPDEDEYGRQYYPES